jgi:hypothetical protein
MTGTLVSGAQRAAPVTRAARGAPYRVAAAALALGAVDLAVDPTHTHIPLCPLRAATGLWCPLCGGLRATYSLAHADTAAALRDNAVFVLALPVLIALWLEWVWRARRGRPSRRITASTVVWLVVVCALFTVLRNLPFAAVLRP